MWEGVGDRTELQHIDPHSVGHNRVSFPFSWAVQPGAQSFWDIPASSLQLVWSPTATAQSGAWGPTLLGAGYLYRILSPTDWISCALSYIIVQRTPSSCGRHNFALIQPVHGQGYNIRIDRIHLLFTQVYFLFWQPGQGVGQYTTNDLAKNNLLWTMESYVTSNSDLTNLQCLFKFWTFQNTF